MKQGFRFWRFDDMESWLVDEDEPEHLDWLRAHVDELEPFQRHMVERCVFGGANLAEAARELARTQPEGARAYSAGLGVLHAKLQEEDEMGPMPTALD